jgi:DNA helicase-2/ATP-dependent DNA helicase PcrA
LRQERGDAIWLLQACQDQGEAAYWEAYYAAISGLPTVCFHTAGRDLALTQEKIDRLYRELDTVTSAMRLADDLGIDLTRPHHVPQATIRGKSVRKTISMRMFGSSKQRLGRNRRRAIQDPWHLHELYVTSSDDEFRTQVEQVLPARTHKVHYWSARRTHGDYDAIEDTADALANVAPDARVWKRARLTANDFEFMPIGHLVPGARVPVLAEDGTVEEDEVISVERRPYSGQVYDLSIPTYRNYIADGIVTVSSFITLSTGSAAPTIATSCAFARPIPTPGSSCWSRTIAAPRPSWTWPTQ